MTHEARSYVHVPGVFPTGKTTGLSRKMPGVGGCTGFGWCPRCGRTKRPVIAHKTADRELLPYRWTRGPKNWCRRRLACTRCRITWDVYAYSHFNLVPLLALALAATRERQQESRP